MFVYLEVSDTVLRGSPRAYRTAITTDLEGGGGGRDGRTSTGRYNGRNGAVAGKTSARAHALYEYTTTTTTTITITNIIVTSPAGDVDAGLVLGRRWYTEIDRVTHSSAFNYVGPSPPPPLIESREPTLALTEWLRSVIYYNNPIFAGTVDYLTRVTISSVTEKKRKINTQRALEMTLLFRKFVVCIIFRILFW